MNDEPEIPAPLPSIARGKLWVSLAIPPAATFIANCITGLNWSRNDYGASFLWVPILSLVLTIGFLFSFNAALRPRYQGRSAILLGFFYFIGQIVICLAVWFGSCFIFAS
ncbi:MAG: hypothetical protein CFE26_03145 [Verrucomicrobiales bacterium VVV1]|nr:MAG: hypothetical protein CFE26_03145 [Verrucomicrobiales bacterium VVV1]